MPRPRNAVPTYRHHKATGRAFCIVRRDDGTQVHVYLGTYDSPESKEAYARLLNGEVPTPATQEPAGGGAGSSCPSTEGTLTVGSLVERFMGHAEEYYRRPDGTQTHEVRNFRHSVRALVFLFAGLPVSDFGPKALKTVRDLMVSGYEHPEHGPHGPVCRKVVNQRVNRIRHVFKWGVAEEMVPVAVYQTLATVAGLKAGRCQARETEAVEPVAWDAVEAVLPHLNPVVKAMVLLAWNTGCRPGEVCSLQAREVDTSGPVWLYRPSYHKLAYRGKARVVAIGAAGQEVLRPFLDRPGFVFSPSLAVEMVTAEKRAKRKTRVQPSQVCRKKPNPKRKPGERYDTMQLNRAIARACRRAGIAPWHPNQLRHSFATRVRRLFGLEAAQVVLGHSQANVTQVYAERDQTLAVKVAENLG